MRFVLLLLGLFALPVFAAEVEVQALFRDAALVTVDGQQKLLRKGESLGGVTLLSADSRAAELDIDGKKHSLGVHRRIVSNYQALEKREVAIRRNDNAQYITGAIINGRRVNVLVDTGANIMALNSGHATALGIDYRAGQPARLATAGGKVQAWRVTLDSVDLAGMRVDHVDATVVEGADPEIILLGMSYLNHVEINESGGVLRLSRGY